MAYEGIFRNSKNHYVNWSVSRGEAGSKTVLGQVGVRSKLVLAMCWACPGSLRLNS